MLLFSYHFLSGPYVCPRFAVGIPVAVARGGSALRAINRNALVSMIELKKATGSSVFSVTVVASLCRRQMGCLQILL